MSWASGVTSRGASRRFPASCARARQARLPLANAGGCSGVIADVVEAGKERGNCMPMTMVTPGYFEAMGIKVVARFPTWSSVEAGTAPTVVTATFAKRFWGDAAM